MGPGRLGEVKNLPFHLGSTELHTVAVFDAELVGLGLHLIKTVLEGRTSFAMIGADNQEAPAPEITPSSQGYAGQELLFCLDRSIGGH
jgi:hypothetical protein